MKETKGARLRRAVKYPTEDTDVAEDLDEQEQEEVIASLSQYDVETTATYRKALMGLVLIALMFVNMRANYPAHPFYYTTSLAALLLSFLSAYDIYVPQLPTSSNDEATVGNSFGALDIKILFANGIEAGGFLAPVLRAIRDGTDLARRYARVANPMLCGLLAVVGGLSEERNVLLVDAAPVFVVAVVMVVARREMGMIGLAELEALRYNYKGA